MTTLYKLTDSKNQTKNKTQWGECVTHSGTGEGELCGPGFIHAYKHPCLAAFFNPIHAGFEVPNLWEAEGVIAINDGQEKCGCVSLTTIKQIQLPEIMLDQRREIAIRCALMVYDEPLFVGWENKWLSGEDRSTDSDSSAAARARAWVDSSDSSAWVAAAEAWAEWVATATAAAVAKGYDLDILQIIKDVMNKEIEND